MTLTLTDWPSNNGSAPATVASAPATVASAPVTVPARSAAWQKLDAALYDLADLDKLPPPEPMIDGLLDRKTIAVLSGKFGTYKTFLALDMAAHLALGKAWHGHPVPNSVKVLYIAAEGVSGIHKRARAWQSEHDTTIPRGVFTVLTRPANLTRDDEVAWLADKVRELGAGLVVVDTWHRSTPGSEENSNDDAGEAFNELATIRDDTGTTMLVLHHTGHAGERARGASSLEDDADTAFVIKLGGDGEDRSAANPRVLHHRKCKDGELVSPKTLSLNKVGNSAVIDVAGGIQPLGQESDGRLIERLCVQATELGLAADAGQIRIRRAIKEATGEEISERAARKVAEKRKKLVVGQESGTGGTPGRPLGGAVRPGTSYQASEDEPSRAVPVAVPALTSENNAESDPPSRSVPVSVPANVDHADDHASRLVVPVSSGHMEQLITDPVAARQAERDAALAAAIAALEGATA